MMENGMSVSDVMALRNDGNGFGGMGDGLIWLVVLFLFGFGGIGGIGGNRGFGNAATAAAQQEILLGQQFEGVHNKLDSIGKGICDSTYAITGAVTSEGRAMQNQLAECCCNTQLAIKDLGHQIENGNAAILGAFKDSKIESLQAQVSELQLRDAMCGVVRYPMGMTYATNCNPFCGNYCGGYQPNI